MDPGRGMHRRHHSQNLLVAHACLTWFLVMLTAPATPGWFRRRTNECADRPSTIITTRTCGQSSRSTRTLAMPTHGSRPEGRVQGGPETIVPAPYRIEHLHGPGSIECCVQLRIAVAIVVELLGGPT